MKIEILFPEYCNLFGDYGNMMYLKECIPDGEFIETSMKDVPYFAEHDDVNLIYMGPMTERAQEKIIEKLMPYKERIQVLIDEKKSSKDLLKAVTDGKRIIVTTLQKFPVIYTEVENTKGKGFAVIVDEAHQGQSGESAKTLRKSLIDLGVAVKEYAELEDIDEADDDLMEVDIDYDVEDVDEDNNEVNIDNEEDVESGVISIAPKIEMANGKLLEAYDPTKELANFKFPTLDLLRDIQVKAVNIDVDEQETNKRRITETLENYGIPIKKIDVCVGPTITLFEIVPADGVRISKIKGLLFRKALSLESKKTACRSAVFLGEGIFTMGYSKNYI